MSEKMLRVQLSELATVRVVCKKCNRGVIEVPLARLGMALDHGACRLCNHEFFPDTKPNRLGDLQLAIEELNQLRDLGVEFEIGAP